METVPEYKIVERKTFYKITFINPIEVEVKVERSKLTLNDELVIIHGSSLFTDADRILKAITEFTMPDAVYGPFHTNDDGNVIRIDNVIENGLIGTMARYNMEHIGYIKIEISELKIYKKKKVAIPIFTTRFSKYLWNRGEEAVARQQEIENSRINAHFPDNMDNIYDPLQDDLVWNSSDRLLFFY